MKQRCESISITQIIKVHKLSQVSSWGEKGWVVACYAIPERETQNMMIASNYTQHKTSIRQNESQYPNERHRIWWLPATIYNKKQVRSRWLPYTREKHKFIIETKLSGKKELEISARNSIMPASVKFEKTYVSSRLLASSALRYRFLSPTIGVVGLIIKSVP